MTGLKNPSNISKYPNSVTNFTKPYIASILGKREKRETRAGRMRMMKMQKIAHQMKPSHSQALDG